ncbi:DNA circularization N-terminal domain-containing protein [Chitinolyticbacter meiyuanensis]|uniref:DNA circularization N-terminal domain-containing protein n=1 Tax=Chitinolyticbacter meiyuanensis TaxID=682798 RepID=UPI0011E5C1B7|nr:DNA circularization N-terminal domain-containing protein [Chitinolyticbacter meiyuanensis]
MVRIGKIELKGVQNLHTEEARTLVEQRVPEQQGSVFQDLGREPVTVVIDGLLFGDEVMSALETLRVAHAKAQPQAFAADIVVGSDLTDVVIEDFRVRQVAGYPDRYRFSLRLREHVEPPQSTSAALAPVNRDIAGDAAAWSDGAVGAAAVLQDPASLAQALTDNPALIHNLDADALGAAIGNSLDQLDTSQLGDMIGAVGALDPAKASGLFDALGKAGSLGQMLNKYLAEGANLIEQLKNFDWSRAGSLMRAFAGGLDFLSALKNVADKAGKLVADIGNLELPPELDRIVRGERR